MFCAIFSGVSFVQVASLKADVVGSTNNLLEPAGICGVVDVDGNGLHRLRFVGRWLNDSKSSDRFNVAHAILIQLKLCVRLHTKNGVSFVLFGVLSLSFQIEHTLIMQIATAATINGTQTFGFGFMRITKR